jgi:hypothetical protein
LFQIDAFLVGQGPDNAQRFIYQLVCIDKLNVEFQLANLDLAHVQDIVDQSHEALGTCLRHLKQGLLFTIQTRVC